MTFPNTATPNTSRLAAAIGAGKVGGTSSPALQKMLTGHLVGVPAMGSQPLEGVVMLAFGPVTARYLKVTINKFTGLNDAPTPAFVVKYQCPQNVTPPTRGTPCLVVFPANEPEKVGWAIDFLGWPKTPTGGAMIGSTPTPPGS